MMSKIPLEDGGPEVSLVLAAYNEEENIHKELVTIKSALDRAGLTYEVIVVNDGSTDRTEDIAREHPWALVITHPVNMGSGAARKTGTKAARGKLVVWTDVDQSYPNDRIPDLVYQLREGGWDQVVGARTSEMGTMRLLRKLTKWFIRRLAIILAGKPIPDLNSGLRVFRRDVAMNFLHLLPEGFSCVSTLTLAFLCNGHTVGYLPIEYYKREGKSKFHPITDTYQYLLQVIRMILIFNPLNIFIPLSALLMLIALVWGLFSAIVMGQLADVSTLVIALAAVQVAVIGMLAELINQRLPHYYSED